jgi:hypothetical protein
MAARRESRQLRLLLEENRFESWSELAQLLAFNQ